MYVNNTIILNYVKFCTNDEHTREYNKKYNTIQYNI
jgi:hypothetical protein